MAEADQKENGAGGDAGKPTELEQKIIRQVEYYFGDINFARDKFMQEQVKEDDGWISMETMLKFNRLSQMSSEAAVIVGAMKKSTSGLMEIHEDGLKIRRTPSRPLPEFTKDRRDDLRKRSVYAKGFPLDSTLDQTQEFFLKYGKVEHIQMRKDKEKAYKGSVFTIFETDEAATKFLKEENTKYAEDSDVMKKMYRDEYFKMKAEEKKVLKEEELKNKEDAKAKQKDTDEENFKSKITMGAILEIKNIPADTTREDIKEAFSGHGNVQWADFDKGDVQARLRFGEEGAAQKAWDSAKAAGEGKVCIKGTEVEISVLEGEEELEHWRAFFRERRESRENKRRGGGGRGRGRGRGGRGGGRGGRGGYRGRQQQGHKKKFDSDDEGGAGGDEDAPPAKQAKVE